jgi:predicted AAA+ superfamily ATPase
LSDNKRDNRTDEKIDELISRMDKFNENLGRIADAMAPQTDEAIFTSFRAFKVYLQGGRHRIRGIAFPDRTRLDELMGIDEILARLKENTEQLLAGLACNNVLLYGPRGTGKSSAIKALLNEYGDRGLRMIEMERDALAHIYDVAELVRGRPEKYIIFCDDLAFEEDESSYRRLKAVLEGGLEVRPENMLICATSNRRHLMPERVEDNLPVHKKGELHVNDAVEEKLSLSDRFGLRLGFYNFGSDVYLEIIQNYLALRNIPVPAADVEREAMVWSIEHGSYSGRTARQFIDDFEGRLRVRQAGR